MSDDSKPKTATSAMIEFSEEVSQSARLHAYERAWLDACVHGFGLLKVTEGGSIEYISYERAFELSNDILNKKLEFPE